MSSHGWHSVSAYFCSSLFIHSAEWLCSLSFSKMLRQNVSVASFLGGFIIIIIIIIIIKGLTWKSFMAMIIHFVNKSHFILSC